LERVVLGVRELVAAAFLAPVRIGLVLAAHAARPVAEPLAAAPPERRRVLGAVRLRVEFVGRYFVPERGYLGLVPELQLVYGGEGGVTSQYSVPPDSRIFLGAQ
ncbi:hypothetical protein CH063_15098, partial [Colletotrichum higginsianum]